MSQRKRMFATQAGDIKQGEYLYEYPENLPRKIVSFSSMIVVSQFCLIINSCANILMYYSVYNMVHVRLENIR